MWWGSTPKIGHEPLFTLSSFQQFITTVPQSSSLQPTAAGTVYLNNIGFKPGFSLLNTYRAWVKFQAKYKAAWHMEVVEV
jgi:hypothetical protein